MDTIETGREQNGILAKTESLIGERGMEALRRLTDRLEAFIRERPGTALLGAIGLGFVVGRIVRR